MADRGAAVAGTFHSSLPDWLNALINGAVFGYFVVFDIVLIRAGRRDGSMRERVRLLWSRGGAT